METLRGPGRGDAEARERFLSIREREAARMRRIVEDLLSLSRIEAEEPNPPTGDADLSDILETARDGLQYIDDARRMRREVGWPADQPDAPGDAEQHGRGFRTLAENAVKNSRPRAPAAVEDSSQRMT